MGVLHELLAAEEDAKGQANQILQEAIKTFKDKQTHFESETILYKPYNEEDKDVLEKDTAMVTTVKDKLEYVAKPLSKYIDAFYQKETANTLAKADIVLDGGKILAKDVPATGLLNLERELKEIFKLYSAIPTLDPGVKWRDASIEGKGIRCDVNQKERTKQEVISEVVIQPTKEHPGQWTQRSVQKGVGVLETTKYTSKLSPSEKSELLARVNELKTAVKKARMRANKQEVQKVSMAKNIFKYINEGVVI